MLLKGIVLDIRKHWVQFVDKCEIMNNLSLGNKYHHLWHGYEHQALWGMTCATDNEQTTEKFNKIVAEIKDR